MNGKKDGCAVRYKKDGTGSVGRRIFTGRRTEYVCTGFYAGGAGNVHCRPLPSVRKKRRCPPGCGSLEEASKCAAQYIYGLIVQTIGKTEDDFNVDTIQSASEKYKNSLKHTGGDTVKSIAAFFFSDSVWTFIGFCGICLYYQTAERRKYYAG